MLKLEPGTAMLVRTKTKGRLTQGARETLPPKLLEPSYTLGLHG